MKLVTPERPETPRGPAWNPAPPSGASNLPGPLEKKLGPLEAYFRGKRVVVALSGGVDSTTLAWVAKRAGAEVRGVTARSPFTPAAELAAAIHSARDLGIPHEVVRVEMPAGVLESNPPDRCYHCKRAMLHGIVEFLNPAGDVLLVEGSNRDDAAEHRPGRAAVHESPFESPWEAFGFRKREIRVIAANAGLATSQKPPQTCLATRVAVGLALTPARLHRVEAAEQWLLESFDLPFVRVRVHPGELARLEFPPAHLARVVRHERFTEIHPRLRALGFQHVTIDPRGYVSGSMAGSTEKGDNDLGTSPSA